MPALSQSRQLMIASLLASCTPVNTIAAIVRCKPSTVNKYSNKIRKLAQSDEMREAYRMLLQARAPIEKRVNTITYVMEEAKNPFARLQAVKYADEINGIVEVEKPDQAPQRPAPLFNLPPGSAVQITMIAGQETPQDHKIDDNPPLQVVVDK